MQKKLVLEVDKKVHGCKQLQFTDIRQKHSSLFIIFGQGQERKGS